MPLGGGSWCSANSSGCRNGSSTASGSARSGVEAADVVVVDVGDLFEDELLDLGLRHLLVDVAGAGSSSSESPARSGSARSGSASDDALLVGVADDQRALAVGEHLLEHDDLADLSKSSAATTLSASLSMTSWPRCSSSRSTLGLTFTRSLRPPVKTSTVPSSLRRSRKVP
jgi:hypothetical protein